MNTQVFWDRRGGRDRRILDEHPQDNLRQLERRHPESDRYVLLLGSIGVDRVTLFVTLPILLVLAILMLMTYPAF